MKEKHCKSNHFKGVNFITNLVLLVSCLFISVSGVSADVRLPHIIGGNMVLQREMPLPIWGWAETGEQVTVELAEHKVTAQADEKGYWIVKLPAMKAGGPHQMTVSGKNSIKLSNILIGEVWACSGQSNMEMGIGMVNNAQEEIAAADYPNIRLLLVPNRPSGEPEPDMIAEWQVCSPQSISSGGWGGFSAAAYFFGRELHKQLNVPIGLIDTSWGGTPIESWTPPIGFAAFGKLSNFSENIKNTNDQYRKTLIESLDEMESWLQKARKTLASNKLSLSNPPSIPPHPFTITAPGPFPWKPTGLYNGMVHPLAPFAMRGFIWYQGESNRGDGMMYHEKMKALITGWKSVWNQGDLAFYFVQSAPFRYDCDPLELPQIWEAQTASLSIPNSAMVVTTDLVDDIKDIHPKNKQDVGKRLALCALAKSYGHSNLVYSGPLYKSMSVEGGKVRIHIDHVGSGLSSRDGKNLTWFEIAGEDKKFFPAQAMIDNDTVLVSSQMIDNPIAVRFGWHQEAMPNLMNKEGLPASPFRTDQW